MSKIQIQHNGEDTPFSKPIKRSLLRDARLTYGARGLFAMLWDFPSAWTFYSSHIVCMSPGGITQLKGYLRELRYIGAIEIVPNQLKREEVLALTETGSSQYKVGQIVGKKWILHHPDLWAVEAPLSNANNMSDKKSPKDRFSVDRKNQASEKPFDGKAAPKVLQQEVSANEGPPLPWHVRNVEEIPSSSPGYIFPKQLTTKECELAKPQLNFIDPTLAQAVLDELAARLNSGKVNGAPLSYLRSLIKRAQAGQFTPEAGIRIALSREQAELAKTKKAAEVIKPRSEVEIHKRIKELHAALAQQSPNSAEGK